MPEAVMSAVAAACAAAPEKINDTERQHRARLARGTIVHHQHTIGLAERLSPAGLPQAMWPGLLPHAASQLLAAHKAEWCIERIELQGRSTRHPYHRKGGGSEPE